MHAVLPADSVAELYQSHHSWLYGWLRKKLGCAHHAADLAQDTFLRVLRAPPPQALREPRAFLTTVAHGLLTNHLRRQALERAYLDALAWLPQPYSPSPESRALLIETLLEIDALLDGLPPKARQAFLLSQLEGLRYADIAERLNVSLSMVKKYMLQAVSHCMRIGAS
ncbi:sigma-70 family RNA polymerase sigma factor [Janthinobacterium fluminis]|uniref:Sigma-70 family RNA polymerase sigma factor n=1 Tax=Janthinobacterium fluminis TaxID=2987524 RepID=A0ABT5K7H9_9BURK|nr:sigma-70 family RNA polymerase sigma factor [Janthinobacterium fluminis]MDC8760859.1 sigma-70 family RNA polymerase sigma factor [Janthinobacterium fluminis]